MNLPQADHAHISKLAKRLVDGINARVEMVVRNGDTNGYPGCVNLSFSYVEGESLLMALKVSLSSSDRSGVLTLCLRTLPYHREALALPPRSNLPTFCVRWVLPKTWRIHPYDSAWAVSRRRQRLIMLLRRSRQPSIVYVR